MLVTLIPLFLAANVSVNNNDWKYGPEVIFDAKFESEVPTHRLAGESVMINAALKMNCRPKDQLILVCQFETQEVQLTVTKTIGGSVLIDKSKVVYPEQEPYNHFELNFHPMNRGVVTISKNASRHQDYIANSLAEQLKVGMGLMNIMGSTRMMENSTVGKCQVTYLAKTVYDQNSRMKQKKDYEIVMVASRRELLHNDVMNIMINRDEDDCVFTWMSLPNGQDAVSPKSSKSYGKITKDDFVAYTDYQVMISEETKVQSALPHYVQSFFGRERVTVSLDKILPADRPLTENRNMERSFPWTVFTSGVFAKEFGFQQYDIATAADKNL